MKSRFARIPKRRWVSHNGERFNESAEEGSELFLRRRAKRRMLSFTSQSLNVRARRDLKGPLVRFSHLTDEDNGAYRG